MVNDETPSEYELQRQRNIERNNARLRALGLISSWEEAESNAAAIGRKSSSMIAVDETYNATKKKNNKKRVATIDETTSPHRRQRKSQRLRGLDPTEEGFSSSSSTNNDERLKIIREYRVKECRQIRQEVALRYSQMNDAEKKAAEENPTATYEHCLMRVKTMNEKKLYNRIKAIERAAGKHCVIKMAIFKSCLQDEEMWDLADAAANALERLKAMMPPPHES